MILIHRFCVTTRACVTARLDSETGMTGRVEQAFVAGRGSYYCYQGGVYWT